MPYHIMDCGINTTTQKTTPSLSLSLPGPAYMVPRVWMGYENFFKQGGIRVSVIDWQWNAEQIMPSWNERWTNSLSSTQRGHRKFRIQTKIPENITDKFHPSSLTLPINRFIDLPANDFIALTSHKANRWKTKIARCHNDHDSTDQHGPITEINEQAPSIDKIITSRLVGIHRVGTLPDYAV